MTAVVNKIKNKNTRMIFCELCADKHVYGFNISSVGSKFSIFQLYKLFPSAGKVCVSRRKDILNADSKYYYRASDRETHRTIFYI